MNLDKSPGLSDDCIKNSKFEKEIHKISHTQVRKAQTDVISNLL